MDRCMCSEPNPPKRADGSVNGNVCQDCHGKIVEPTHEARLMIEIGQSIQELPEADRAWLIGVLIGKAKPWVREVYKTGTFNRRAA